MRNHTIDEEDGYTVNTDMSDLPNGGAASLPHPDSIRIRNHRRRRGKGATCLVLVAVATGIATVLLITLGITRSKSSSSASSSSAQRPSEPRKSTVDEMREYIVDLGLSQEASFEAGTPQREALEWLAEWDPQNLQTPAMGVDPNSNPQAYEFMLRYVMVVVYYSTLGSTWSNKWNFLSELPTCRWNGYQVTRDGYVPFGILCDSLSRAGALYLDNQNLRGELPSEVWALTTLQGIDFNFNEELKGQISHEICKFSNLQRFTIGFAEFYGEIPDCLNNLSNLEMFFAPNNKLQGPLPSFTGMDKLQILFLDDNRLTGDITTAFNELPDLRFLMLEDNGFTGVVDSAFLAKNKKLVQLDVSDNQLMGQVPVHLLEFPSFELLDMHGNALSGPLPSFPATTSMFFLALHDNDITGSIDASIADMPRLFHLDLSNNTLTGPIPEEIGLMQDLMYLFLGQNDFEAGPIPDSFENLIELEEFSLKSAQRTGPLPPYIGNWTLLKLLDLDDNSFEGPIPFQYGDLNNLEFLLLNANKLNGDIPSSFNQLSNLRAAFFEQNNLTGSLEFMCEMSNFREPTGDADGDELLVADCSGNRLIECECCVCCDGSDSNILDRTCNDRELIANLNPTWEAGYTRVRFDFGNDTRFVDEAFLP